MTYQTIRGWAAAGLLAGAVAMPTVTLAQSLDAGTYEVGFITEKTGPLAAAGISYWNGAVLAMEEINEGTLLGEGVSLELVEKESGSDAARAVQSLTQFAADRNIKVATCCILSPVAGALKPVAKSMGIPLIIYGATRPGLPELPFVSSVVALPGPAEVKMTQTLADSLKPKKVTYFVNADNDAFQARFKAAQEVMEKNGVETGEVISILGNDTDFTGPATQAMATDPDLIMVWTTQTPAVGIVSALRQRGYEGKISSSDVISPVAVFEKAGKAMEGVPFPILFSPSLSKDPRAQAFIEAYQTKYGEQPDTYSAQGYTVMYYLTQALKTLEGNPSREEIANALAAVKQIDDNIYGGLPMIDGQATVENSLIVNWTDDGKLAPWDAK
ncbi:ABC transporter substrate-binding protein [Acuticoccus sp. I52.16.1]|uniref:ABC transporter substrate-binding protein n=1 Tax=Acuticoccus sp. I52.16.1 TaxID=2928472 RepID=UPI001FD4FFAB|nr:ABC transporter substrate-binding protein [Acuticoccus sp. I52.16.1]UOM35389.1 ABC transporter substrate-binding protein [Acuticoccus sp. I52.16.1]